MPSEDVFLSNDIPKICIEKKNKTKQGTKSFAWAWVNAFSFYLDKEQRTDQRMND